MRAASKVRRTAFLATWVVLGGCASAGGGFDQLPADEQAMFRRCRQPLGAHLCRGGSAQCLEAQAETFAARRSSRMRRNWLVLNECPAAVIDGTEAPAEVASTPPAAVALLATGAACRRSAECESDLCVRGLCLAPASLEVDKTCNAAPAPVPAPVPLVTAEPAPQPPEEPVSPPPPPLAKEPASPAPSPLAKEPPPAQRPPPEHLREAIVEHEADMKRCVERQLKLVPDLRAEGTLVLEVDAAGKVTRAALRGERLQGTALEGCVRAIATRWVFPRKARAYAVEAPLHVSGVP